MELSWNKGPVLLFINGMPVHLQTDIDMYADDTITHTAGKRLDVVEPKLQISAGDFNTWCIDDNMGVHYGKNTSFAEGMKYMTSANESISITINEHSTESVNTHMYLVFFHKSTSRIRRR